MATSRRSEPDQTLIKMPSLRAVRCFVAAAKYQSFTRAAEALCVTQAAISRQIRELEIYLGTELFVRTGRAVKLSADGMVFFDAAQLSFVNISQAAERLRVRNDARQTLTVCCSPAFSALWLRPRLPAFFRAHPEIELRVLATHDFLNMESSVRPDALVTKVTRVRDGYSDARLFHDTIYPVCAPEYLQRHGPMASLETLREAELLDVSPYGRSQLAEHVDWSVWLAFHGVDLAGRAKDARPMFSSNDYVSLVQLAMDGVGIALGWDHLVAPLVAQGLLVRPVEHLVQHQERCHYLSIRTDKVGDSACTHFGNWMKEQTCSG